MTFCNWVSKKLFDWYFPRIRNTMWTLDTDIIPKGYWRAVERLWIDGGSESGALWFHWFGLVDWNYMNFSRGADDSAIRANARGYAFLRKYPNPDKEKQ